MTDDLKAAIEKVRNAPQTCACDVFDTLPTALALAEIGRLAVEERIAFHDDSVSGDDYINCVEGCEKAADAFLAGRGT